MKSNDDDALAATVAPSSQTPVRVASTDPPTSAANPFGTDATMAAPVVGDLPPLPTVSHAAYISGDEIARGGMGRIVAAEDRRLRRPVAIKELLDPSPDQLGRFQREALITARLQHPGIVPVYEAGLWPSGEPFFAMKMVSGRPLDKVISELRTLPERIALLPRVAAAADAIAYAHSQRVIHRDLKPANVLIGDFGETVVIDWGLAKDLDASDGLESAERTPRPSKRRTASTEATLTVAGAVMGTPAYMAPEQARGESVDERADVFALGAMLYHLLAGKPPYDARTATDVITAAAIGRVVPLERREAHAPADLVAIVHRAMAQETSDRYANAGELADELRRFMTGQLVQAHRYTTAQRLGRFIKKHRAAVAIGALSVIAIAGGTIVAMKQIIAERDIATSQRTIAESRRVAAEQLIDRMLDDIKERLQAIGRLDVLANLGGEIRDYYATLASAPGGMTPADSDRITQAVNIVAGAQRDSGQLDAALATWTEERTKLAATVGTDTSPSALTRRGMLARVDYEIGTVHQQRGNIPDAIAAYRRAKAAYDALLVQAPRNRELLLGAANTHDKLGDLLRNEGKLDDAFDEYQAAKTQREALDTKGPRRIDDVLGLSMSHMKLGSIYMARGESAAAQSAFKQALRLRETLAESEPDNVEVIKTVIDTQTELAYVQRGLGDDAAGIQTLRDAITTSTTLARRDPTNTVWKRGRANMVADLGFALLDIGAYTEARDQLDAAIALQKELLATDPKTQAWQGDLARSHLRLGDVHLAAGDPTNAIAAYKQSLGMREALVASNPKSIPYKRALAWGNAKLASGLALTNDLTASIASHERAFTARTELVAVAKNQAGFRNELASTELALGRLLTTSDPTRASRLIESGANRAQELVDGDAINFDWKETLTQAHLARAALARATNRGADAIVSYRSAATLAQSAIDRAPSNVFWPGYFAEAQLGIAELTLDPPSIAAARLAARTVLEPLALAKKLPAQHAPLLARSKR